MQSIYPMSTGYLGTQYMQLLMSYKAPYGLLQLHHGVYLPSICNC